MDIQSIEKEKMKNKFRKLNLKTQRIKLKNFITNPSNKNASNKRKFPDQTLTFRPQTPPNFPSIFRFWKTGAKLKTSRTLNGDNIRERLVYTPVYSRRGFRPERGSVGRRLNTRNN